MQHGFDGTFDATFDYVIVGAGSAGCVLANRLSADPDRRVLLLEAGPRDRSLEIHMPAGFKKLFQGKLDWAYETEPEPICGGRRLFWPRGKVLGGSSSINAMLYVRGHRLDYDRWRDAYGCEGWGYDDILPLFRRSENHYRAGTSPEHHGADGPLDVVPPRHPSPFTRRFVEAGLEIGLEANDDFNGPRQEGIGLYDLTQRDGRRCSTAVAFLRPALARPNLTVRTGAHATRVLFATTGEGPRAVGVETIEKGRVRRYRAEGEVLLSGGAVNSPQLLLLSGVGPAEDLRAHGIEVVVDSPGVGANLQDHVMVSTVFRSRSNTTLDPVERFPQMLWHLLRWLVTRTGPLTTSVCEGGAFVRTDPSLPWPDLQFHFIPAAIVDHGFHEATDHGFNFGPTLIRPKSRGRITLRSIDPLAPPKIEARYFSDPQGHDLRVLVEGVKLARRLAATSAFADELDREIWPGEAARTDAELEAFVRERAATLYHPAGTCAMGPDPARAVVDPKLRVHGVQRLRVVDASIMPELIGGNTNAPTILVAEKAAEAILGLSIR